MWEAQCTRRAGHVKIISFPIVTIRRRALKKARPWSFSPRIQAIALAQRQRPDAIAGLHAKPLRLVSREPELSAVGATAGSGHEVRGGG